MTLLRIAGPSVILPGLCVIASFAQQSVGTERDASEPTAKSIEFARFESSPLDAPLDAASYQVGPGDVFNFQIESSTPVLAQVAVGLEGYLLIPTVGAVEIGGLSLAEAQERIRAKVSGRYLRAPVLISLQRPRRVVVHVMGSAVIPQPHPGVASDRVSTVLGSAGIRRPVVPVLRATMSGEVDYVPIARRSIQLRKLDGTVRRVDLDMFAATGDSKWNPHVTEGDEIVANVLDEKVSSVAIGGFVWVPGEYEWLPGDEISTLLKFAKGVRPGGRVDSVLLMSVTGESDRLDLTGPDSASMLKPGDRVWVSSGEVPQRAQIVSVSGEVRFPGAYPVTEGRTRLSELLWMCGGPTQTALLNGATLHRNQTAHSRRGEERFLAMRGNSALEDSVYVRLENEVRLLGERVDVDFRKALAGPGSVDDPFVEPGDRVVIPRKTGTVYVFGQVVSPGLVRYEPGYSFDTVIRGAGGFASRAKEGEAMVIKRASRQWLEPDETTIEEGDAIWVPKDVEYDFVYELTPYTQIAAIISSIITLILIINQGPR